MAPERVQMTEEANTSVHPSFAGTPPAPAEPMKLERLQEEATGTLRGGERSEACPGRFCFIIPCPIPCDFCCISC